MASIFKRHGTGPWIVKYYDSSGRRREHSTRTTDKRLATSIASKLTDKVVLRKEGIIDANADAFAEANAIPIAKHLDSYLAHLWAGRRNRRTLIDAKRLLTWLLEEAGIARLSDLTPDRVEAALSLVHQRSQAARTYNAKRGAAVGFMNWAVKTRRVPSNPLRHLAKLSEDADRRRERRALTNDEIGRLLAVAEGRGRKLFYLFALWAGLRRGEMGRITWGDVDLQRGVLRMSKGKAKRLDEVPLHPDLLAELRRVRGLGGFSSGRIFPSVPTNETRTKDYNRAGIKLIEEGLHADLHSLRSSLCTMMALQHVPAEVARRVMRHSDYRTTAKHYLKIQITDAEKFVAALPSVPATPGTVEVDPHQNPHQSACETVRKVAS
jgi:integrase